MVKTHGYIYGYSVEGLTEPFLLWYKQIIQPFWRRFWSKEDPRIGTFFQIGRIVSCATAKMFTQTFFNTTI